MSQYFVETDYSLRFGGNIASFRSKIVIVTLFEHGSIIKQALSNQNCFNKKLNY